MIKDKKVSNCVHLMESNRKNNRQLRRFFRKPKFSKMVDKIIKINNYYLVCSVGNPVVNLDEDKGLIELFFLCVKEAWDICLKLGGLILAFFKARSKTLLKLAMNHPWIVTYGAFASCALMILYYLAKKFQRKWTRFQYLLFIILWLLIIYLFSLLIQAKAFNTIFEWFKSILFNILFGLRSIKRSIPKKEDLRSSSLPIKDKSEPPKSDEFKTFIFFSVLTILTTKCLLKKFKRKIVGDGLFVEPIIEILDSDMPKLPGISKLLT